MSKQFTFDRPMATPSRIDREGRALHGVQVAMLGEARGHGLELDSTTLDQIVALGNQNKEGVKCRFNHPDLCNPSLGTVAATRTNFRRSGAYVLSDLNFLKAADKKLVEHVLDLAEEAPHLLGSSVVVTGDAEDREGKGPDGKALLPVLRVEKLHAVDLVDDPASGTGLFGAPIAGVSLSSREMTGLREALQVPEFVERALSVLSTQAKALGLSTDKPEGDTRGEILRFLGKCKPHHFEAEQDMPRGYAFHAIENDLAFEDALEGLYDRNVKHAELSALESASTSITVGAVEGGEGEGEGARFGSLEQSFFNRFQKLGYSQDEAERMAREAASRS